MKAIDFERNFDEGEDIIADLDLSKVRSPAQEQRVNIDFSSWMKRITAKLAYRALRHYCIQDETEKGNRYGCIIR